jgi:hypothetical protein
MTQIPSLKNHCRIIWEHGWFFFGSCFWQVLEHLFKFFMRLQEAWNFSSFMQKKFTHL